MKRSEHRILTSHTGSVLLPPRDDHTVPEPPKDRTALKAAVRDVVDRASAGRRGRIVSYANVVGKENVIAGTDCGMRIDSRVEWAKLERRRARDQGTVRLGLVDTMRRYDAERRRNAR